MSQIRETIECLCSILFYHGAKKVNAEAFRQAKFDKPEATEAMWFALFCFNCFEDPGFAENQEKIAVAVGWKTENIIRLCKHKMFGKGYKAWEFYTLPEAMTYGSRQVLLAIGWLLAKEKVIDNLIRRTRPVLGEDPLVTGTSLHNEVGAKTGQIPRFLAGDICRNMEYTLKSLVWLNGKLIAFQRKLLAAMHEYSLILIKAHAAVSKGSTATNHLSLQELHLLRHRSELEKLQTLLENENLYFMSLLVWKRNQDLFWKWMSSILHNDDKKQPESTEKKANSSSTLKPSYCLQKVKEQQIELSKLLQCEEKNYKKISKSWKNIKTSFDMSNLDVSIKHSAGLCQIEEEVFGALQCRCLSTESEMTVLKEVEGNLKLSRRIRWLQNKSLHHQSKDKQIENSSASQTIEKLSVRRRTFHQELDRLRMSHQETMFTMSEKLEGVICIPISNVLK